MLTVLAELASAGITLVLGDDGGLRARSNVGSIPDEARVKIHQHKNALVAHLRGETILPTPAKWSEGDDSGLRPLTAEERADIARVFAEFRSVHGRTLAANGWDRAAVFGDLDPLAATVVDEIHGIIAVLRSGGTVGKILQDQILFRDRFNWPLIWTRGGMFVAPQG